MIVLNGQLLSIYTKHFKSSDEADIIILMGRSQFHFLKMEIRIKHFEEVQPEPEESTQNSTWEFSGYLYKSMWWMAWPGLSCDNGHTCCHLRAALSRAKWVWTRASHCLVSCVTRSDGFNGCIWHNRNDLTALRLMCLHAPLITCDGGAFWQRAS